MIQNNLIKTVNELNSVNNNLIEKEKELNLLLNKNEKLEADKEYYQKEISSKNELQKQLEINSEYLNEMKTQFKKLSDDISKKNKDSCFIF